MPREVIKKVRQVNTGEQREYTDHLTLKAYFDGLAAIQSNTTLTQLFCQVFLRTYFSTDNLMEKLL